MKSRGKESLHCVNIFILWTHLLINHLSYTLLFFRLNDNVEVLNHRLKSLEDSRAQLEENLKQQTTYNRLLDREMTKLKLEIQSLMQSSNKLFLRLQHLGIGQSRIQHYLGHEESTASLLPDTDGWPHHDEKTWYLPDCLRPDADRLLAGRPDGTFLIRPSSTSNKYALSIQ